MSGVAACLSDKLRPFEARWEGRLVDVNTGTLRRDHVLVQRTPGVELFIGLGASAARAMDFVFDDDRADDFAAAEKLSGDRLAAIEDRHLRRLALLEALFEKAAVDDPVHPGYPAGAPGDEGGQFRPKDDASSAQQDASGNSLLVPVSDKLRTKLRTKEVGNIVFNETRSLSGPGIDEARVAIAHAVRNGEAAHGDKRPLTAPSNVGGIPSAESSIYRASQAAAERADRDRQHGADASRGATHFTITIGPSTKPFMANPYLRSYGPFDNSYPNKQVPSRTGVCINLYR